MFLSKTGEGAILSLSNTNYTLVDVFVEEKNLDCEIGELRFRMRGTTNIVGLRTGVGPSQYGLFLLHKIFGNSELRAAMSDLAKLNMSRDV